MAHILLVAHAPVASALLALARHAYPDSLVKLAAVDVAADAVMADSVGEIRRLIASFGPGEVLILVDAFGATPCNAAVAAAEGLRVRIVAGANGPMIWRTLCYADRSLDDLVDRAILGGQQGVMHVVVPRRQYQGPTPAADDQVKRHHQQ